MAQVKRGCGCAIAALLFFLLIAGIVFYFVFWPEIAERRERRPPPPAGGELRVHILDVGQADSILIVSPEGKVVLIDAGDTGAGRRVVLEALKRNNLHQIDLLIASHAHADHIGGADEVIRGTRVLRVLDSTTPPPDTATGAANANSRTRSTRRAPVLPTTKAYEDFLSAIVETGAERGNAEPGQKIDIGGNAFITILAPLQPYFTKEQLRSGGNEPNANSIVARLDYGEFSMLLTGDAEAQTEERLISTGAHLTARILKVGHHGSRYATSERFIRNVRPEVAMISTGETNRYGHPSQEVLDRLRAQGVRVYRTDLQGEVTIASRGRKDYEIKTAKETTPDLLWVGRQPQKDDSSRSGFVSYGEFGSPPSSSKSREKQSASGR